MKISKKDFIELSVRALPEPFVLVWCKKIDGKICLAYRLKAEYKVSKNAPWENCCWRSFSFIDGKIKACGYDLHANAMWSDTLVESWAEFSSPKIDK